MNASLSVVCYKSKRLSNGESPLMLQVSKGGKRQYQSLGVSVNPKFWDFSKNKPKSNCPNREYILKLILNKQAELQQRMLELNAEQKEYTTTTLLHDEHRKFELKTVKQFYQELIEQYKANDKCGNRLIYKSSYNSINVFTNGNLEIPFSAIDVAWLNKYEKWLRSKGNKETTMSLMFRTLRSAYNKAIDSKCARKSDYPFNNYRISKFDVSTEKRAIAKADILKFSTDVRSIGKQQYVQLSKDIFIFSYLCGGINFTDIANLTKDNIIEGKRLHYIRQKTGKLIKLGLSEEAIQIIRRYAVESKGYLFPILNAQLHKTPLQKQNRIHKMLGKVNKNLKLLAADLGVEANLTTYVARHSFASVLKKSGVNIALISEALGHSDLTTTQIYLDSFDNEQIDNAMKNLL
ncbi:site-specific integrase [Bacteroides stercoris]|jgi:site-specific recombinase XerD|uniref:Site-specific integrase n=1 Tax=Bacteroides stercoris TaxID=46506 RepID=A0A412E4U5_BACSE|nr:site-specific integrase [Bacteroides stercoris]RGR27749.1 site-specific integrase [Bacteroides stercoris]RGR36802.1 site-specific integrase [Bacteroides stercoris]